MIFTLPGFDSWTFQIVICGRALLLEAVRGKDRLSACFAPGDCRHRCAHALISRPCCALAAGHC
jgi:hypothetical protein